MTLFSYLDSSTEIDWKYIVVLICFFGGLTILFFMIGNKELNKRVLSTSPYIKKVVELNKKYFFQVPSKRNETRCYHLNSKRSYDNFDCVKKLDEILRQDPKNYKILFMKICTNILLLKMYDQDFFAIPYTNDESIAKASNMSLKSYRKREAKLANRLYKSPQTTFTLRIKWEYTSPKGQNHYSNHRDFSYEKIVALFPYLNPIETTTAAKPINISPYPATNKNIECDKKIYSNDDIEDIED